MSIPDEHVRSVCRLGQGADCCRYLVMGDGFQCVKLVPSAQATIDQRVAAGAFTAQGDNCEGLAYATR